MQTHTGLTFPTWNDSHCLQHLLNIVVLRSQVAEHVTVVTVDIATEHLDVVFGAELVDPYHQVSGAACQTHLRDKTKPKALKAPLHTGFSSWLCVMSLSADDV